MNNSEVIKHLKEEKVQLEKRLEALNQTIKGLQDYEKLSHPEKLSNAMRLASNHNDNPEMETIKKNGLPLGKIIRQIISRKKKVISIAEICQSLQEKYEIKVGAAKKIKINTTLSSLKYNKIIKSSDIDGKENRVYGLTEWFDEQGNIKEAFKRETFELAGQK